VVLQLDRLAGAAPDHALERNWLSSGFRGSTCASQRQQQVWQLLQGDSSG
jgi:hypothetical protein